MNNYKYTFILPAYKARYLKAALETIQNQTYGDFRVVVSDDCSPEDLFSICKPYLEDERFDYVRNVINIGGKNLVNHWNLLLERVQTPYFILASDDDVYDVDFLEKMNGLVERYPTVNVFRARARRIERGEVVQEDGVYEEKVSQLQFIAQCYNNFFVPGIPNYIFKTEAVKDQGGFYFLPYAWASDFVTLIKTAENGLVNSREMLFSSRLSDINITGGGKDNSAVCKEKALALLDYDKWMKGLLAGYKPASSLENYLIWFCRMSHREYVRGMVRSSFRKMGWKEYLSIARRCAATEHIPGFYHFFYLASKFL